MGIYFEGRRAAQKKILARRVWRTRETALEVGEKGRGGLLPREGVRKPRRLLGGKIVVLNADCEKKRCEVVRRIVVWL